MKNYRAVAKHMLQKATRKKFDELIEESNVTDEMREIAFLKLVRKETYVALSFKYNCSAEHIRDVMQEVYDKVYEVIKSGLI